MVFDRLGEVLTGIEEDCDSSVVFCEYLDYCWKTKDSWGVLMTESFNGGGTDITGGHNSFIFELLSLQLKHWLSRGVLCEELDDCWQTEDIWVGLMTESFNGGRTGITSDANSLLFEWLPLRLNHRLARGVIVDYPDCCLFQFFGRYQYTLDVSWWMQYEFVVVLCACYFVCLWPTKGESQIFGATTAVMFMFQYQE